MINTNPAYRLQLETNVSVTLSMTHLAKCDVTFFDNLYWKREYFNGIEVIANDDFRLILKISEDVKPNDQRLSQPLRNMLSGFYVSGIRIVVFDVDAEVMDGFCVSESRLNPEREILSYEGNASTIIERIKNNEMVMLVPSKDVNETIVHTKDLVQNYPEYDPITAHQILELHQACGHKIYFA